MKLSIKTSFEENTELVKDYNKIIEDTAYKIWSRARELAPVDTGFLRNSIIIFKDAGKYYIISNAEYSSALEYGTSAHWVKPVKKKALHWTKGNKDFFSKGHIVSGVNAQPFMRPAFQNGITYLKEKFK